MAEESKGCEEKEKPHAASASMPGQSAVTTTDDVNDQPLIVESEEDAILNNLIAEIRNKKKKQALEPT